MKKTRLIYDDYFESYRYEDNEYTRVHCGEHVEVLIDRDPDIWSWFRMEGGSDGWFLTNGTIALVDGTHKWLDGLTVRH